MNLHRFPADLAASLGFTLFSFIVIVIPVLRDTPLRFLVGVPLVLFVPGYVLVSALYPAETNSIEEDSNKNSGELSVSLMERITLSFVSSMAMVSIVGLVLNYTPFGFRIIPTIVALCTTIILLIIIADYRRRSLEPENRLELPWQTKFLSMKEGFLDVDSKTSAAVNILLLLSILLAFSSAGYVFMTPTEGEAFTEFYILTDEGELNVEEYPTEFVAGEPQSLVVGIENQEYQSMNYTVLVNLHRIEEQTNSTQISESERIGSFQTKIEHNETWQQTHNVTPQMTGDQLRLTYTLYRGNPPASPTTGNAYRKLQLLVNVTSRN